MCRFGSGPNRRLLSLKKDSVHGSPEPERRPDVGKYSCRLGCTRLRELGVWEIQGIRDCNPYIIPI